jgi:phosphate-selective porin OprO/OprP
MSAVGGGSLISQTGDDVTNLAMTARYGTRFLNNGLWFSSNDKRFQIHIGGRLQLDTALFEAPASVQYGAHGIGPLRDGVDPRRARFRLEGQIYEQMEYVSEFDLVNSAGSGLNNRSRITSIANSPVWDVPVPTDLWWGFRSLPLVGNLRVGNQKEPLGFERQMSSRFLNFMERSFNQDAFYSPWSNGFSPGAQLFKYYTDHRVLAAFGVFNNMTNPYLYSIGGLNLAVTGRLVWQPIFSDDGSKVLHLGISGRQSAINEGINRFRVRGPERAGASALWPTYADTGLFRASGGQQDINLELVSVYGPWTFQAEYDWHFTQNASLPNESSVGPLLYQGGYVELSYFLTGEHRVYIRESGLFDRVVPRKNAYLVKTNQDGTHRIEAGRGAWQAGIRYNYLCLDDKGIDGGILNDITLGLTWFINPNWKYQWNYSVTNRLSPGGDSSGWIQGFGMRMAFDY